MAVGFVIGDTVVFQPKDAAGTLAMGYGCFDGSIHGCFIIDISSAGAGISAEIQPPIGTPLAIGACVGRVIRVFETGFAVKFLERQDLDDLSRLIIVKPRPGSTSLAEERISRLVGQQSTKCA